MCSYFENIEYVRVNHNFGKPNDEFYTILQLLLNIHM